MRVFIGESIFCYRNGHPKQYILVDTIFSYMFHFGLQENVFRKVCAEDLTKDMFLKSKMKSVVKYYVY